MNKILAWSSRAFRWNNSPVLHKQWSAIFISPSIKSNFIVINTKHNHRTFKSACTAHPNSKLEFQRLHISTVEFYSDREATETTSYQTALSITGTINLLRGKSTLMWIKAVIPCLINHHSIKTHEKVEVPDQAVTFLIRIRFGCRLSSLRFFVTCRSPSQANVGIALKIRLQPLPSKSFPTHHSLSFYQSTPCSLSY
jgi:hypothetical protein